MAKESEKRTRSPICNAEIEKNARAMMSAKSADAISKSQPTMQSQTKMANENARYT